MDQKHALKLSRTFAVTGLSIALAMQSLLLPLSAYAEEEITDAEPIQPQIIATDTKLVGDRLVCDFTYLTNEDITIAPDKYCYDGQEYEIESREVPVDDTSYIPSSKTFNKSRSAQVPLNAINNFYQYFPVSLPINSGEYIGEIGLDENPFTYVNGYSTQTDTVSRSVEFSDLKNAENSLVPQQYAFQVRSASAENATEVKNLDLTNVAFSPQSWNEFGEVASYRALCTYTGTESYLVLTHYNVEARYSGEIKSNVKRMIVKATYKPVIVEEPYIEPEQEPFNFTPYIIAGAAVATAGTGIFIAFWIRRKQKVRIVNAQAGNVTVELIKPIINGSVAFVEIPPKYDLTILNQYAAVMPNRIIKNCDTVKMSQTGYEFYVGTPKEIIPIYCENKNI